MASKDWEAWIDTMPGAERALYVTGKVEVDNTRFGARLKPEQPGTNPAMRRLRYEIYEKSEIGNPAMTYVEADQYREPTDMKYEQVEIQPDGGVVDVRIVS
jgi:hypothetical protein